MIGLPLGRGIAAPFGRGVLRRLVYLGSMLLLATAAALRAEASGGPRTPQWPLKTSRVLLTDEQIAQARQRCKLDPQAQVLLRQILEMANYWAQMPDEQLRALLPDCRVPRAFDVSSKGCPVHGTAVFQHGTYPWKLDREHPFSVTCPVGGERYPSNDFAAYYRSGMPKDLALTGPYLDTGRGWTAPDGEKYWFVGYACEWNWLKSWIPAVTVLGQAYVLTGERLYAHKAIVMLDRIAEIYPGFDYGQQSRFGELRRGNYRGKISNAIWEEENARRLAIGYDEVFDCLGGAKPISLPWRSAEAIRANVEANLLEEILDATDRRQISGQIPEMYPNAFAYAVAVRQNAPQELLNRVWNGSPAAGRQGLDSLLYNQLFKDGLPYESSPSYNGMWAEEFLRIARPVSLLGRDLLAEPRVASMLESQLQMVCAGKFTPAIGDAGAITDTWLGSRTSTYLSAYRRSHKPEYAWVLDQLGYFGKSSSLEYADLFEQPITWQTARQDVFAGRQPLRSRILDGYGLSVLNNAKDTLAASCYYGLRGDHGHYDRLNLEVFGMGQRLSPDLGYPDAMNEFVPGIHAWTKNTVSHNCLLVDDKQQDGNIAAKVLRFHDGANVHVVDIDGSGSYSQTTVYRRTLVLVETGPDEGYLVDVFRVRGGKTHVLSMHGPEGAFAFAGAELPAAVKEGTYAGRSVSYGQFYDDAKLNTPGYRGPYATYTGSGYQYLFNWQQVLPSSTITASWTPPGTGAGRVRVHVLPHAGQEVVLADAYVSPTRKVSTVLKYALLKRSARPDGNTFVTIWEVAAKGPDIQRVEQFSADSSTARGSDDVVLLSIARGGATDILAIAPRAGEEYRLGQTLASDAAVVVLTVQEKRAARIFAAGGSTLTLGPPETKLAIPAGISGTVRSVDYRGKDIVVGCKLPTGMDAAALRGKAIRIFNPQHSAIYTVHDGRTTNEGLSLRLAGSDFFTGRVKLDTIDPTARGLRTHSIVTYPANMAGMFIATADLARSFRIKQMEAGLIQVQKGELEAFAQDMQKGREAWIVDFGPGDSLEIEGRLNRG